MPRASSWTQTTLLPPEAVEAVLRVGVVGAGDHVQVQVEARDALSGELLAMWSNPHSSLASLDEAVERAGRELVAILSEIIGPF